MSDENDIPKRQVPFSAAFVDFIQADWEPYPAELPALLEAAPWATQRRERIGTHYPEDRLVFPAGDLVTRSNDTDYLFRPHTAFAYFTGLGVDKEPGAVLVLEPTTSLEDGNTHRSTLYFRPRADRSDAEFYADPRYGEMWVGTRESLEEMASLTGLEVRHIDELEDDLRSRVPGTTRIIREADPQWTAIIDTLRGERTEADHDLAVTSSTMRLVKDDYEIEQLHIACDVSADGFEAVVREIPHALASPRGERWLEGTFTRVARHVGNDVGYTTISAAGDHANTLHWIRNNGDTVSGDLLLMDAGIEVESLYTADITRTVPLSGQFSQAQLSVYEAVLEAQEAGIAAARPGAKFSDVHKAAVAVIARYLAEWGMLPVPVDEALSQSGGQYRRWMVHGTSHHLGLDVHDCAQARDEDYRHGTLEPGMVITVEPGIYIKSTDLLAPEHLRGIGVRIEDDILITEDGNRVLSDRLPKQPAAVESWMNSLWDEQGSPQ